MEINTIIFSKTVIIKLKSLNCYIQIVCNLLNNTLVKFENSCLKTQEELESK